jgi:nucleotide-binding universal stress UspA family protein
MVSASSVVRRTAISAEHDAARTAPVDTEDVSTTGRRHEMKPIMLATDGSPAAAKATDTAIRYAGALDAPLLIVSVWEVAYEPMGIAYGPVIPELDHVGRDQAQNVVDTAAAQADAAGVENETLIRRGTPVQEICAIADERDPQLIVLGTHGWGAFRRALFGSVSTGVTHHAKQPVLVVPAAGPTGGEPREKPTEAEAVR